MEYIQPIGMAILVLGMSIITYRNGKKFEDKKYDSLKEKVHQLAQRD